MIGYETFSSREVELTQSLAQAIAERDGIDWSVSKLRYACETEAAAVISARRRNPDREPLDTIERIAAEILANERALAAHRQKIADERAEMYSRPALDAAPKTARFSARDPSGRVIVVMCHEDGSMTWAWAS